MNFSVVMVGWITELASLITLSCSKSVVVFALLSDEPHVMLD